MKYINIQLYTPLIFFTFPYVKSANLRVVQSDLCSWSTQTSALIGSGWNQIHVFPQNFVQKISEKCHQLTLDHGRRYWTCSYFLFQEYISGIVDIKHSYWIGLVERQHEGHWSWVDGTNFNSTPTWVEGEASRRRYQNWNNSSCCLVFRFWDEGQPDNWSFRENGEDCGQLHASLNRKRKLWNDADCSLGYRYICEAKAWDPAGSYTQLLLCWYTQTDEGERMDKSKTIQPIKTSVNRWLPWFSLPHNKSSF